MQIRFDVAQSRETVRSIDVGVQGVRDLQATLRGAAGRLSDHNEFGAAESQYVERSQQTLQRIDQLSEQMELLARRLSRKADQFEDLDSSF